MAKVKAVSVPFTVHPAIKDVLDQYRWDNRIDRLPDVIRNIVYSWAQATTGKSVDELVAEWDSQQS